MVDENKQKLLEFLDRKVFDPALRASPIDYNAPSEKGELQDIQQVRRSEKDRYRTYRSAQEVRDHFHDDVNSEVEKRILRELRDLRMPALRDVAVEFERVCLALGVH